jgi:hypothetical protein
MPNPLAELQNFNIAGNAQNALLQGMQTGEAMRQRKEQREREMALDKAYQGMMSGDQTAVNALAAIPGMAKDAYTLQQGQKEKQIRADVAAGRAPATALAEINWDDYAALSKEQAEIAKQNVETIGQLALLADTPQKWDATIDQLGPQFAQYKGQFAQREAIIARAGEAKAFLEQQAPKYMAPVDGAPLINVKDPAAVNAWNSGGQASAPVKVTTIDEARALPPGTKFIDPKGVERTVPGGGAASNGGSTFPGWH